MKWIRSRQNFVKESENGQIADDALHTLSMNDDGQDPQLKDTLDKLDAEQTSGKVVTRFAPSPTGFLHIGGIRTALYNYLFAKKNNGIFYLRIEDTDQKRFVEEAESYIKSALEWCGIVPDYSPWDGGPNGPYRQSERDYSSHTETLIKNGHAYYAFDTETEMNEARSKNPNFAYSHKSRMEMRNSLSIPKEETEKLLSSKTPFVIRFKMPENKTVSFHDIIRGDVSFNTGELDDKVLVKSNGIPTYHMANVCDDHDMGTSHVIRGEEWLSSTPLHILLYEAFGWKKPEFAHLPLIMNPDGKGKLSKRKALQSGFPVFPMGGEGEDDKGQKVKYKGFKDEGYEPDALVNFLLLLGWAPKDNQEIMSMADMISKFSLHDVNKSGARFDIDKAKHFNQTYISQFRNDEELAKHIDTGNTYSYDKSKMSQIIELAKKRSVFVKDMQIIADIFFKPISLTTEQLKSITDESKTVFQDLCDKSNSIDWQPESIKQAIFDICASHGIKMGKIMPSLRVALTGGIPGPDLMTTMDILGKDESKKRLIASIS